MVVIKSVEFTVGLYVYKLVAKKKIAISYLALFFVILWCQVSVSHYKMNTTTIL